LRHVSADSNSASPLVLSYPSLPSQSATVCARSVAVERSRGCTPSARPFRFRPVPTLKSISGTNLWPTFHLRLA
jgi:hypothetical protein